MARLGNRTSSVLRGNCLKEMVGVQEILEGAPDLPWFIISEATWGETTVGDRRVKLPGDFIREVEEAPLMYRDVDGEDHEIVKGEYQDLEREYSTVATGTPLHYAFRGDYLVLFPTPDAVYELRFPHGYYARQDPPQDLESSHNPWFRYVSDLILAMTGSIVAGQYLKDVELVGQFASQKAEAENRFVRLMTAHEEANRDRVMNPR